MRTIILFCLLAHTALAQQSAKEIMLASSKKVLETNSFEYDFFDRTILKGGGYLDVKSHTKSMRNPKGKTYFLVNGDRVNTKANTSEIVNYSMSDSGWVLIDHQRGVYKYYRKEMTDLELLGYRVTPERGTYFDHFYRKDPMSQKQDRYDYTLEAEEAYGGVMCHVISMPYKDALYGAGTMYWYIGKEDLLPRGYKSKSGHKEVSNLKVNNLSNAKEFELEAPYGYVSREVNDSDNVLIRERIAKADDTDIFYTKGKTFPAWEAPDATGKTLSSELLRGKVVVYDFWGSWCMPCLRGMPKLQELHEEYKDKEVVVLGFSVRDKPGKAEALMEKKGYTYVHVPQALEIARKLRVTAYPTVFIVDQDGVVVHAERSFRSNAYEEWVDVIEAQLEK